MTVPRTQIREYIDALLIAKIADVGGRVFLNRRSKLFNEELPAICVEAGDEPMDVRSGDKYHPNTYERNLQLAIVIGVEETLEADQDPQHTYNAEALLDTIGHKVEMALGNDWRLARLLDGFDANTNYQGLADGLRIIGGATYDPADENGRRIVAREIGVVITYETQAFENLRHPLFKKGSLEFVGYEDYESLFDLQED